MVGLTDRCLKPIPCLLIVILRDFKKYFLVFGIHYSLVCWWYHGLTLNPGHNATKFTQSMPQEIANPCHNPTPSYTICLVYYHSVVFYLMASPVEFCPVIFCPVVFCLNTIHLHVFIADFKFNYICFIINQFTPLYFFALIHACKVINLSITRIMQ